VPAATRLLFYLDAPGQVYVDSMTMVSGTVPGVGENLLVNGDFESPLGPAWKLQGTNATNTAISTLEKVAGNSSLDLRFFPAGNAGNYFYQDLPQIVSANVHTLSFWYRSSETTGNLQWRMSASFRSAISLSPGLNNLIYAATPGNTNSAQWTIQPFPPIWLNEVLPLNSGGRLDNQGESEPWIELYNSSAAPIALDGLYLTDTYLNLTKWSFPPGATLQPGEFKVVVADGETGETTPTEWHTNFRIDSGTGSIALGRISGGAAQVVDYLNFDNLPVNRSYGACPDAQLLNREELFFTTPGAANNCSSAPLVVYINEWMAANSGIFRDPADNDAEDWFELYNPGPAMVDLGGYRLADSPATVSPFVIPNNGHYKIPPNGFLLVWADGEAGQNSTNRADLHTDFSLRQAGEAIILSAADGTVIDSVTFFNQTNNVSEGRFPDGTGPRYFMPTPTPRGANVIPVQITPPEITGLVLLPNGDVQFSFGTATGYSYQVLFKNDLNDPQWMPLGDPQSGTGSSLNVTDNIGVNPQQFYRIFVQ
jgi:hypothetical protein